MFTGQKSPSTDYVWFYEVEEDAYNLDAKRNARPGQHNDLWDALVKFRAWIDEGRSGAQRNEKTYLQPSFHPERWRQASLTDTSDKPTSAGKAFAGLVDTSMWDGQVWNLKELFGLPADPKAAEIQVRDAASRALYELVIRFFAPATKPIWQKWQDAGTGEKPMDADKSLVQWQKAIKSSLQDFNRAARDVQSFFEPEDSAALPMWKALVKDSLNAGLAAHEHHIKHAPLLPQFPEGAPVSELADELAAIAREVAKLDGFDVTLRSLAIDQTSELKAAKHWVVPVRAWSRNEDWRDGGLKGSHDADGLVRQQYVDAMLAAGLYDEKEALKDGLLDPDCIEARDWNLSAGQYKPFDFTQLKSDKSVSELIGELRTTEQQIISGLDKLLAMVEGRE